MLFKVKKCSSAWPVHTVHGGGRGAPGTGKEPWEQQTGWSTQQRDASDNTTGTLGLATHET